MANSFTEKLKQLSGQPVAVETDKNRPEYTDGVDLVLQFGNGAVLGVSYWRVLAPNMELSSFDHNQLYGLSNPINTSEVLQRLLDKKPLVNATLDCHAGDLVLKFSDGILLQVFGFTGYESWNIKFPDGSCEYSNYSKADSFGS